MGKLQFASDNLARGGLDLSGGKWIVGVECGSSGDDEVLEMAGICRARVHVVMLGEMEGVD